MPTRPAHHVDGLLPGLPKGCSSSRVATGSPAADDSRSATAVPAAPASRSARARSAATPTAASRPAGVRSGRLRRPTGTLISADDGLRGHRGRCRARTRCGCSWRRSRRGRRARPWRGSDRRQGQAVPEPPRRASRPPRPSGHVAVRQGVTGRPEPDNGIASASTRTDARAVSTDRPSGSGIVTAQPPDGVQAVHVDRDVEPSRGNRPPRPIREGGLPPSSRACPRRIATGRREHPRLGPVEDLAAEQGGVLLEDRRARRPRRTGPRRAPADDRERHAPDVPGRRRVGRVEFPAGIEPGERDPRLGPVGAVPRGRRVRRQSPPDESAAGPACRVGRHVERGHDEDRAPRQER